MARMDLKVAREGLGVNRGDPTVAAQLEREPVDEYRHGHGAKVFQAIGVAECPRQAVVLKAVRQRRVGAELVRARKQVELE